MSSDSSSLLKGIEASEDKKAAGDVSNAGLVVNSGDVLESNREVAYVMYPGSDSVPAGVMWLCTVRLGNSNAISFWNRWESGIRFAASGAEAV